MKTRHAFWGVFLLSLGGLFFLHNFGLIAPEWNGIWKLWPLLLVLWGVYALIPHQKTKWFIAAAIGLFLAMILFWFFSFRWLDIDEGIDWRDVKTQVLQESYHPEIKHASLLIRTGATKLRFDGTTDDLINVTARSPFGSYVLDTEKSSNSVDLELSLEGGEASWPLHRNRHYTNIRLNPNVSWDLRMKMGVVSANLDLVSFNVESVVIEAGAASIKLRLGSLSDNTSLDFQTGASSITVEVPKETGCKIEVEAPLSKKTFREFKKLDDETYVTDNFEVSSKKIILKFEAGVSKLLVKRY